MSSSPRDYQCAKCQGYVDWSDLFCPKCQMSFARGNASDVYHELLREELFDLADKILDDWINNGQVS